MPEKKSLKKGPRLPPSEETTPGESTESALKKSEATLKSIFRAAPTGIGLVANRILMNANDRLCDITGYTREEMVGQSARMLYPTREEFEWVGREKYGQISKFGTGTVETRWLRKDGRIIDVLLSSTPLEPSDLTSGVTFTALDITEWKQAEQALRESENRFRTAFENAPGPISMNSPDGHFMRVNSTMCDLLGYSEEALLSGTFLELIHPKDERVVREHLALLLDNKTQVARFESRCVHQTGRVIPASVSISLLRSETGEPRHFLVHLQDLSQRDNLREQLLQAQKMKAVGTLAGGVAHDFNNLLMAIQGRISLMLMDLAPGHSHSEHLKIVEGHIQSAASLTRELLGFARGGKYTVKPTDLNELLQTVTHMFGRTRKEIRIHALYQPDLFPAEVDQSQIKQALMNIYINAWQAMRGQGDLAIETRNVSIAADEGCPEDVQPGDFVKISVTDTGVGMDEETRRRVFEPFFTTQQMGRGTGMGLAATYGIIKHHGGFITVDSEKEKGTTFCIFLPASKRTPQKTGEDADTSNDNETILLVDDEAYITEIGKQLLENLGYDVITAGGGGEAIEIYKDSGRRIDLVILDMVMPHPNGEETLKALRKVNQDVKIIISSGYCLDANAPPLRDLNFQKLIQKPFNLKDLSMAVREVLK